MYPLHLSLSLFIHKCLNYACMLTRKMKHNLVLVNNECLSFPFPPTWYTLTVLCSNLSSPANGYVTVEGTTEGSVANYSCEQGYRLLGMDQRTCLQNAQWSGTESLCVDSISEFKHNTMYLSIY